MIKPLDPKVEALAAQLSERVEAGDYDAAHLRDIGIRSRQITAVLALLIEKFPDVFTTGDA